LQNSFFSCRAKPARLSVPHEAVGVSSVVGVSSADTIKINDSEHPVTSTCVLLSVNLQTSCV